MSGETLEELVSVVIPCYNHAHYLSRAIRSVLSQSYRHKEIIVVDDGSKDDTKKVANSFPEVTYVYQDNQGLSAARNTGVTKSAGEYLIFLDADDWLCENGILTNLENMQQHPEAAFISGAYLKTNADGEDEVVRDFANDRFYEQFLERNYIGMIATVMFRRRVFDEFRYDTSLKACEDYDLFLKVARKYPVFHHQRTIAAYFFHDSNMSGNIPMMLDNALRVLKRQESSLKTPEETKSYRQGIKTWKEYYSLELYDKLLLMPLGQAGKNKANIQMMAVQNKKLLLKIVTTRMMNVLRKIGKRMLGARKQEHGEGAVNLGDLDRTTPISTEFGYDRGGPVDRYYIENFLEENRSLIKGQVLEIGDNDYTLRFGGDKIVKSNILHIDDSNPQANYVGDLSNIPSLPDNYFDCIVLTQTLHLIYEVRDALKTCYRVLKPGGALLITSPGITHIDHGEWRDIWLWSFTDTSLKKMLAETFSPANTKVNIHGNVLVATAFLYGLGLPELKKEQMDETDPHYQVIITASVIK